MLNALIVFRNQRGFSPSIRELAAEIGASAGSVHNALARLEDVGAVRSKSFQTRTWVPTRAVAYPEAAE